MVQYNNYFLSLKKVIHVVSSFSNLKHKELVVKKEVLNEYFTSE